MRPIVNIPNEDSPEYGGRWGKSLLRGMGYSVGKKYTEVERRRVLAKAYRAELVMDNPPFPLRENIEAYGEPESEQRFFRICKALELRGVTMINRSRAARMRGGAHYTYRCVHATFDDGLWFTKKFGGDYDFVVSGTQENTDEPLLLFICEKLPTLHHNWSCSGRRLDGDARLTMDLHGSPNTGYSVKCSFCGEGMFDEVESTYGKTRFRSHADLVSRSFSISDFVDEESFNEEWERQRGRLNPEAEEAIARAYLSDHIAPMRADIEEMAGISGDPILRYRLDTASPEKRGATTNNRS